MMKSQLIFAACLAAIIVAVILVIGVIEARQIEKDCPKDNVERIIVNSLNFYQGKNISLVTEFVTVAPYETLRLKIDVKTDSGLKEIYNIDVSNNFGLESPSEANVKQTLDLDIPVPYSVSTVGDSVTYFKLVDEQEKPVVCFDLPTNYTIY